MEINNRKAKYDYNILEEIECGIELVGTEVKSIRNGSVNLKDSYAIIKNGEAYLLNTHISLYEEGNIFNHEELKDMIVEEFQKYLPDKEIFTISAATKENVDKLMYFVSQKVDEIERPTIEVHVQEDDGAYDNDDSSFEIYKLDKNTFMVQGGKIKRLASVTDARNPEQIIRLQHIMTAMGVFEALKAKGIKNGDTLIIDHLELVHYDDSLWDEGNGY